MANSTEFLCDRKFQDLNGNIKCESTDKLLLYNPYFKKLRISPAMNIKDVQWENPIQSFISKEGLHHMATCQTVMFRGVLKLLSLVCVAGPGQGKSIGNKRLCKINTCYFLFSLCSVGSSFYAINFNPKMSHPVLWIHLASALYLCSSHFRLHAL